MSRWRAVYFNSDAANKRGSDTYDNYTMSDNLMIVHYAASAESTLQFLLVGNMAATCHGWAVETCEKNRASPAIAHITHK